MTVRIHPSILSADFVNFEREFESISASDSIHVDVMDSHFVPNLTFGLPMVKRMQQITTVPLDVHLMISNPDDFAQAYAETGAASVTFHAEATGDMVSLAKSIRSSGAKVGVAVKPNTGLDEVLQNLSEFDLVLVMTVEPGFGGQKLIEGCLEKVREARSEIDRTGLDVLLQVDGGIDESNIGRVAGYGADTFVAGSAVFSAEDRNAQIDILRAAARAGAM
jgi:ribulose-phosphate 3-epimerase